MLTHPKLRPFFPTLEELAERFAKTGALRFGEFVLKSGQKSDHYFDVKRLLLDPHGVSLAARVVSSLVADFGKLDAVGGPEVGPLPLIGAALVRLRDQHARPLPTGFFVRKEVKPHGTGQLVEGDVRAGHDVAMVEDVVTTAGSLLRAVDAIEAVGARVRVVYAVVNRGGEAARSVIEARGAEFLPLFEADVLLQHLRGLPPVAA